MYIAVRGDDEPARLAIENLGFTYERSLTEMRRSGRSALDAAV